MSSNEEPRGLAGVRVVLVEPSHPGNVGAVARAMKTMAVRDLVLINPARYPSAEATARASGADDILAAAPVVETLDEALAGCVFVAGTTARRRHLSWPLADAAAGAGRLLEERKSGPVALLFGREHSGLTNEEVERCNMLVRIPANPEYSSLNLAAAAQILCYELFRQSAEGRLSPAAGQVPRIEATVDEVNGMLEHLRGVATAVGFLDPESPRLLMRRLSRLFNRARLERTEVQIVRGLLAAVERKLRQGAKREG
ncbi:MAG: RNA methyltransferase [Gammaproteobacteria bacterium]|nr:RNA methyltransferase [Gammaproteobacteria bacterium]